MEEIHIEKSNIPCIDKNSDGDTFLAIIQETNLITAERKVSFRSTVYRKITNENVKN